LFLRRRVESLYLNRKNHVTELRTPQPGTEQIHVERDRMNRQRSAALRTIDDFGHIRSIGECVGYSGSFRLFKTFRVGSY
jgi:hypothetical protein